MTPRHGLAIVGLKVPLGPKWDTRCTEICVLRPRPMGGQLLSVRAAVWHGVVLECAGEVETFKTPKRRSWGGEDGHGSEARERRPKGS